MKPRLLMICGPNGSGKSTFTVKSGLRKIMPVIDPDLIAKKENLHPVRAGKETSKRAQNLITEKCSFAKESTMTSHFDFRLMGLAKKHGFEVELFFIALATPADSIYRIEQRKLLGGHGVPAEDVIRRYGRSLDNLPKALSTVTRAVIVDNSQRQDRTIAIFENQRLLLSGPSPVWLKAILPKMKTLL